MRSKAASFLALLALGALVSGCSADLWLTPDQQGRWHFERGEYAVAAERFEDPLWRGTALYFAEQYETAIGEFSRLDSAQAWFNRGNAHARLKQWQESAEAYEKALEPEPAYLEARENLEYVKLRIPWRPEDGGGDMGTTGKDARPDEITFDADAERLENEGREMELEGSVLTDEQMAEMWLRQVDPSPARFLERKFAYQLQRSEEP